MVTVAADVSLPPMVSDSTRPQAPATRYEEHRAAVTAASSDAESAVSGPSVAGEPSERGVPLLPSIKESMPFLDGTQFNAKQTESTAFKPGSKTDPSSCIQRLQPTPPFMCEDARKDQKSPGASLPPLLPTSSTPSTTSSPNVCAQCAPNEDPANVDLRAAAVQKAREIAKEIATEAALPERVGGQDWGERRKQAKLKQTFGFTCPRSQRAAQLKLTTSKLVESLPAEAKTAFLAVLQRYAGGEVTPEDLAESMKALVDTHNIVVPLQGDEPAHPHMAVDSPDQETNIAVFMKPSGKRCSSGAGPAGRGKGKAAKAGAGMSPASATGGAAGKAALKKLKTSSSSTSDEEPRPSAKKAARGGGGVASGSARVLKGALTPVSDPGAKMEEEDDDSGDSAWDALLSVCAQMPRQKTK